MVNDEAFLLSDGSLVIRPACPRCLSDLVLFVDEDGGRWLHCSEHQGEGKAMWGAQEYSSIVYGSLSLLVQQKERRADEGSQASRLKAIYWRALQAAGRPLKSDAWSRANWIRGAMRDLRKIIKLAGGEE